MRATKIVTYKTMKYMFRKNLLLVLLMVALMCSCVSHKQLVCFRDVTAENAKEINQNKQSQSEPRIQVADALVITVSALDPEAVLPYNLPNVTYTTPTGSSTTNSLQYYTVDMNGDIDFPILGKLHVVGKTQSEVIEMIKGKLVGQLNNPVITIRFLNAKVTILGEVRQPGSYPLDLGGMTILEALGAAGDLTQYGRRDNILVTRENHGKLEFARLDLRSKDIFTSPYFYLQQNDVIYVEPNSGRTTANQSAGLWVSVIGTLSSAATVIISVLSATGLK